MNKYISTRFMSFEGDLTPEAWVMTLLVIIAVAGLAWLMSRWRGFRLPTLLLFAAVLLGLVYYFTFVRAGR